MWQAVVRVGRGVFRGVAFLFMLTVVGGVAYFAWERFEDRRLERRIAEPRKWPEGTLPGVPYKVWVKTRCANSRLEYIVGVEPTEASEPAKAPAAFEKKSVAAVLGGIEKDWPREFRGRITSLVLSLNDRDGFEAVSVPIETKTFDHVLDDAGQVRALAANGSTACDREAYARGTEAKVGWRGK